MPSNWKLENAVPNSLESRVTLKVQVTVLDTQHLQRCTTPGPQKRPFSLEASI